MVPCNLVGRYPKNGTSAMSLTRILGLSYKTTWSLLHKIRRAMVRTGRSRLSGCIKVDETYIGGLEEGVRGRKASDKALVLIAAEENSKKNRPHPYAFGRKCLFQKIASLHQG